MVGEKLGIFITCAPWNKYGGGESLLHLTSAVPG